MKAKKINIYDQETKVFLEIGRAIKLGLTNLLRNKALTLATIFVIAIMVCIFNSILAVNFITQQALQSLNEKVDIVLYLKDDISFYDATSLKENLSKLPGVKSTEYISKEDALKIISKTYPETPDFLLKFNVVNPFPQSISIVTTNAENYQNIIEYIQTSRYKDFIEETQDLQKNSEDNPQKNSQKRNENQILSTVANNLIYINQFVKQLIFWIVLTFIIGGTLIIVNAIQLTIYTRRNEIYIMRLVGATPNFIRLPFMIEGICYGLFAVILSFIMTFLLTKILNVDSLKFIENLKDLDFNKIFFAEILLSTILGIISSFSSVQKYLKGKLTVNS